MDGIIFLVVLIPVIIIILLITLVNKSGEQHRQLESLHDQLRQLNYEVARLLKDKKETAKEEKKEPPVPVIIQATPPVVIKAEPVSPPVPVKEPEKETAGEFSATPTLPELLNPAAVKQEKAPKPAYVPNFISDQKKETDYEKFIGENIANKIGIAILVLGISFFIKYAIDKDWIHEAGRVIIGLISGAILIGFAHYFRNQYHSFSSVLVGGGLSVFYFSIAFAFHQYHLISQGTAFIIMVIISAGGVFLSLYYNRQELAILATIGGFITPFLVSTGQDNYVALFTYLCILNTGLMVLAWFKRWPAINTIALFFTTLIYGGWLIRRLYYTADPLPQADALLFASLFYGLFMAMHIINTVRLKDKFRAFDFMLLLSTSFLYYLAGMLVLDTGTDENYKGLFTAILGVFNLVLAILFYHKQSTDRNFVSLLIGLAISFISLVAPVQFNGNHITLFWAAETVVLFWLYLRSNIRLLKLGSLLLSLLMLISLFGDWMAIYPPQGDPLPVILNRGFITGAVVTLSLFLYYLLQKRDGNLEYITGLPAVVVRNSTRVTAVSLAYLIGAIEINHQFGTRFPGMSAPVIYLQAYTYLFVLLLLYVFRKHRSAPVMRLLLTLSCFALYVLSLPTLNHYSRLQLENGSRSGFMAHWIGAAVLLWLLYQLIRFFFREENKQWKSYRETFTWICAAGIVLLLSAEMYQLIFRTQYRDQTDWTWWENLYFKAGLSILWGLCSFVMMWLGMNRDFRPLRIISLTLFTVTIGKLFLYDIINIPPGGKIAAFILLGVLLLAVSFMYQRLKKIILDNKRGE